MSLLRRLKWLILSLLTYLVFTRLAVATEPLPEIKVYKSPTCDCCSAWIEHLEQNGFKVSFENVSDVNVYKQKANLPRQLASCHTGFIEGYAVEGHVPAGDIHQMLQEQPDIQGLAVPGMPMGSPGMDFDSRKAAYNTISYTKGGELAIYASH